MDPRAQSRVTDDILDGLVERFDEVHARHGQPVAVVGWSLGGLMARWLAHLRPDAVERIVGLGSPWRPEVEQNRVTAAFRAAERHWGFSADTDDVIDLLRRPVPVRSIAVYSPWDGDDWRPFSWRRALSDGVVGRRARAAGDPDAQPATADVAA